MNYTEIIKDPKLAEQIIKDCYFTASDPIKNWEAARKLIANTIENGGTILDIGCANGFLLKSLQHWSQNDLECYGIDAKKENIENAHKLFSEITDHFLPLSFEDFLSKYPPNFPQKFDFILWAVWTNFKIEKTNVEFLISHLNKYGRLILAFYPDSSSQPSDVINNEDRIKTFGYTYEKILNDEFPNRNEKLLVIKSK